MESYSGRGLPWGGCPWLLGAVPPFHSIRTSSSRAWERDRKPGEGVTSVRASWGDGTGSWPGSAWRARGEDSSAGAEPEAEDRSTRQCSPFPSLDMGVTVRTTNLERGCRVQQAERGAGGKLGGSRVSV